VLAQRDVLSYLARTGFTTGGLLHEWLIGHFQKTISFGGYEIWLRQGRSIAAVSTARVSPAAPGVLQSVTMTVKELDQPISQIELCNIDSPDSPLVTFVSTNCHTTLAPCGLDGHIQSAFRAVTFGIEVKGLSLLQLEFSPIQVSGSFTRLLVVLRDAQGRKLDELLLAD
jgi:hypothetical protein